MANFKLRPHYTCGKSPQWQFHSRLFGPHPIFLRSMLTFSSHKCLGLPSGLFLSDCVLHAPPISISLICSHWEVLCRSNICGWHLFHFSQFLGYLFCHRIMSVVDVRCLQPQNGQQTGAESLQVFIWRSSNNTNDNSNYSCLPEVTNTLYMPRPQTGNTETSPSAQSAIKLCVNCENNNPFPCTM
jgi:hypothetical protein